MDIFKKLEGRTLTLFVVLFLIISILYGPFLWSPLVFDDSNFFDGSDHDRYRKIFDLDLRWLPFATFEWTKIFLGGDVIWLRLGNLILHLCSATILFFFLRELFNAVLPIQSSLAKIGSSRNSLSYFWLAFFGAAIFALHPAAVYAVAYLIQRSTLMATLFSLLSWLFFVQGITRERTYFLWLSVISYFFAVFSKEVAIMAPAVSLALLLLLRPINKRLITDNLPVFIAYFLIGLFVFIQVSNNQILGQAYEPRGADFLSMLLDKNPDFDPRFAYPLSVLTQCSLFFKYLAVWLLPSSRWMSIDMYEPFATQLWSWHIWGGFAFLIYLFTAIFLLLKRGTNGLLGLAMLAPSLLFFTELSTVKIQESFVLYRSYLWMPLVFVALPFIFKKATLKLTLTVLILVTFVMFPLSYARLTTFSHSLLLWDDAARLINGKDDRVGVDRIYHNRGIDFLRLKLYSQSLSDFNKAIQINPNSGHSFSARGTAYLETSEYSLAIDDFTRSIKLYPKSHQGYLGRAKVYEVIGNLNAANIDYQESCLRGAIKGCEKARLFAKPGIP